MINTFKALEINSTVNVATVEPGLPFVKILADSWNPEKQQSISSYWFMPNTRACFEMRQALIKRINSNITVRLPIIEPITSFSTSTWLKLGVSGILDLPPIVPKHLKHVLLMTLVSSYQKHINKKRLPPHRLLSYVNSLNTLMQEFILYNVDINDLEKCVEGNLSEHWKANLNFFSKVIFRYWSDLLSKTGCCERNVFEWELLKLAEKQWQKLPPNTEVVIAGSTGARPTTAKLMSLVRKLKNGSVILPSFNTCSESCETETLQPMHPKYCIHQWLQKENIKNSSVSLLLPKSKAIHSLRIEKLIIPFSYENNTSYNNLKTQEKGLHRIDCKDEVEEVATIAYLVAEKYINNTTSNSDDVKCIIITANKNLATRVENELKIKGIPVANSLGLSLLSGIFGKWLMLITEIISGKQNGIYYMDLLNHVFTKQVLTGEELDKYDSLLRQKQDNFTPSDILELIKPKTDNKHKSKLKDELFLIATKVDILLKPLFVSKNKAAYELKEWVKLLEVAIDRIGNYNLISNSKLYSTERKNWQDLVIKLKSVSAIYPKISKYDLPGLIRYLLQQEEKSYVHRRSSIEILSPFDARYATADRIILAGFNDTDWPKTDKNIWLSKGIRAELKMESQDIAVGLSVNDILDFCTSDEVYFTRSISYEGEPTLPSRWLGLWRNTISSNKCPQIDWFHQVNGFGNISPCPRPPSLAKIKVSNRPKDISVSGVKTIINDPYSYYTKYILKIQPKEEFILSPNALNFGTLVHNSLERFLHKFKAKDIKSRSSTFLINSLLEIAKYSLLEFFLSPTPLTEVIWLPRLKQLCTDYISIQKKYLSSLKTHESSSLETETKLYKFIDESKEKIKVSGRCDLIRKSESSYEIIDYKTGSHNITKKNIVVGLEPQLGIEAYILQDTASKNKMPITQVSIWQIKNTGQIKEINFKLDKDIDIDSFSNKLLPFLKHFMYEENSSYYKVPINNSDIGHLQYKRPLIILSRQYEWNIGM